VNLNRLKGSETALPQDVVRGGHPPKRVVRVGVDHEDLPKNESGECIEVHRVNAAIDNEVAHYAKKN